MGKVITIDLEYVLWLLGFIASAWGVVKIIKELKKPNDDLKETVRKHEEWLVRDNERIKSIESLVITQEGIKKELNEHSRRLGEHEERLEEDKQRGNLTLKANIAIINNMLSENDKDKLQETRDEIQDFLLEKN
ncbi:hypothetical protein [Holdemanella biformis]|uniref:hypothetical protein n=1 Tax=Holdemanella biformis TaxID=1735 RepID=UPI00206415BD|nr:MAG TPA: hypothetical protein [Bacteriophage sp.]